jgi:hypothetical protein
LALNNAQSAKSSRRADEAADQCGNGLQFRHQDLSAMAAASDLSRILSNGIDVDYKDYCR